MQRYTYHYGTSAGRTTRAMDDILPRQLVEGTGQSYRDRLLGERVVTLVRDGPQQRQY